MTRYMFGLDLGKKVDRSALAVLRVYYDDDKKKRMQCGHMRQWRRDTPYMGIVQDIGVYLRYTEYKDAMVVYDQTGLGNVFQEMLEEAGIAGHGVTITSGQAENVGVTESTVPKGTLVTGLIAKIETGVLTVHKKAKLAKLYKRQLAAFHSKTTDAGHVQYGGRKEHDDLVLALAAWGEKYGTL